MSQAADYSARRISVDNIEVVKLIDTKNQTEVSVVPSIGNNAYSMMVKGCEVFFSPYKTLGELQAKPTLVGNPFLMPWANRLDHEGFYANGKHYVLNMGLKNVRPDGNHLPIHGLLQYTNAWSVISMGADRNSAHVTSRLEFWKHPDWIAQFPFAHTIEMTYRLKDGALEVETSIENLSLETMPLSMGFHPYFQLPKSPRDEWKVTLAAKEHVKLSNKLTPTGERDPVNETTGISLANRQLDDVFTSLIRDARGLAEFSVTGAHGEKISVVYGPKYNTAVVYAPPGRPFICFEPMTGVTNAFNLAHEGKYSDLQTIAPGQKWKESYFIRPSGF